MYTKFVFETNKNFVNENEIRELFFNYIYIFFADTFIFSRENVIVIQILTKIC